MKKKLVSILILCVLTIACAFGLIACDLGGDNSANTNTTVETQEEKNEISFKTLLVDGTNVYGKIPNNQNEFDFLSEIEKTDNVSYKVCKDKSGSEIIESKTVEALVGDNVYYIFVYVNGDMEKEYTVTVRRKPLYTVTFDTNGGTIIASQMVEEDAFIEEPIVKPVKRLFTFKSWNFNFNTPITSDKIISANYEVDEKMKNFEFTTTDTTCKITGLKDKTVEKIKIPSEVTEISAGAFKNCLALTKIEFSEGLKSIGEEAFTLSKITEIDLPDSCETVGESAFRDCTGLTKFTAGDGMISLGNFAFWGCTSLTTVDFGNNLKVIRGECFEDCTSLNNVVIPASTRAIYAWAFKGCTGLTSLTFELPTYWCLSGNPGTAFQHHWCAGFTDVGEEYYRFGTSPTDYAEQMSNLYVQSGHGLTNPTINAKMFREEVRFTSYLPDSTCGRTAAFYDNYWYSLSGGSEKGDY